MIVSFDLTGILCLITIPPIIVYLCRLGWELAHQTNSRLLLYRQERYVRENQKLMKEYNALIREHMDLKEELKKGGFE